MSNIQLYQLEQQLPKPARNIASKSDKHARNISKKRKQPRFGICFDVDGVLARGTIPFPRAVDAFKLLQDDTGQFRVPVTFVTNALNKDIDKAREISDWLDVTVSPSQMIQAQGPLEVFTKYHDKFCLIVGQGKIFEIAKDLGFKKMCTVEEIAEAHPLLDIVDHDNRKRIAKYGYREKDFQRVEAIILMGEPKRWESSLQLLVDLLKTDGKPDHTPEAIPERHLPVIACNMDLQFMDRACMPRYGHGAFLLCLEMLYKKVTGLELVYTALVGKPSEVTFRYAEHCLTREAKNLGIDEPLERLYLIGDTPEVDIVGSNLYQRYVSRLIARRNRDDVDDEKSNEMIDPELPQSRNVPRGAKIHKQTVREVESYLVCTGVYNPDIQQEVHVDEKNYQGHRDFPHSSELYKPTHVVDNVLTAIQDIMDKEHMFGM